jgi:hypothetical protein
MRRNKMNQLNPKTVHSSTAYHRGYQQALSDFGLKDLLAKLRDLNPAIDVEEQDQESLVAILIQQLTNNLNSKLLDNYYQALESGLIEILLKEIQPPSKELPIHFKETPYPATKMGKACVGIQRKEVLIGVLPSGAFMPTPPICAVGAGNTLFSSIHTRPVPLG